MRVGVKGFGIRGLGFRDLGFRDWGLGSCSQYFQTLTGHGFLMRDYTIPNYKRDCDSCADELRLQVTRRTTKRLETKRGTLMSPSHENQIRPPTCLVLNPIP